MSPTTAEINLFVELDDDRLPIRIQWEASEAKDKGLTPCHSVMLSLWDGEQKTVAAIDLWTKDTTIADINLHFYQTFHKMADTYLRATKNADTARLIHEFSDRFGKSAGLQ